MRVRLVLSNMCKPSSILSYWSFQGGASFVDPFCYLCFVFVCNTVLSVPCSLVVTCWVRADLLALLYVMFSCVFVTSGSGLVFDCTDS